MPVPEAQRPFWNAFARAQGGVDEARFYEAFAFGDSPALADELAALVLQGTKRATAGALWAYEVEAKLLPRPGELSIVTSGAGVPLCVIETLAVEVLPFDQVDADFAATEGEGDGSLAFWRQAHTAFFSRECAQAGRVFQPDMPVVCERFRLVYAPPGG
jgi:uncharacterized protein YhfF